MRKMFPGMRKIEKNLWEEPGGQQEWGRASRNPPRGTLTCQGRRAVKKDTGRTRKAHVRRGGHHQSRRGDEVKRATTPRRKTWSRRHGFRKCVRTRTHKKKKSLRHSVLCIPLGPRLENKKIGSGFGAAFLVIQKHKKMCAPGHVPKS